MLPAVQALRQAWPGAEVSLLARAKLCELHAANPLFDRRLALPKASYLEAFRFQWGLRREGFDLALVFPESFSSAFGAFLTGATSRVGRIGQARGIFLTRGLPCPGDFRQRHVSLEYLDLAVAAGASAPSALKPPRLPLTPKGRDEQEKTFRTEGLKTGNLAAICPTSAFGPSKCWPPDRFGRLARLLQKAGMQPLLFGAEGEERSLEAARSASGMPLPILKPSLAGLAACLSKMALVVANDSGPLHLAAAVGVPCLGLYGPVSPVWSGPLAPERGKAILYLGLECSPCHAKDCPLGHHRCLEDIGPERAMGEIRRLLRR
jgi:heptosyltransferase-2